MSATRPLIVRSAPRFHRSACWLALQAAFVGPVLAQTTPATTPATPATTSAAPLVITGNPLGRDTLTTPSSVLSGDALVLRRAGSLGETLDGLPGVAGTGFGPNANRPVVRGLDGDRVRLLDNGGAASDASNLSFDHAVAIDPLAVERLEVLRGPAALMYGGNATGGVVNAVHNRIPRAPVEGFSGRTELRLGGAAQEKAGAVVLEAGAGAFAWHLDAFGRDADDQRTPQYTPVEGGVALDPARRVRYSASQAKGAALGGSWFGESGRLGLAVDTLRHDYGVTAEEDVKIRLEREHLALAGEQRLASGPLSLVEVQAGHTRYQHQEVEGTGEVGTTFSSRGQELRLQARHRAWGGVQGVWGLQAETLRFSALGEEAFVPSTHTRNQAVYALESWQQGGLTLSAGLRAEQVRVRSDGDAADAAEVRFGDASERRYKPLSGSVGAVWKQGPWSFSGHLGHTERAPAYYELYANGLHLATAAYEQGDPSLGLERSQHLEAGLAWAAGGAQFKLNAFQTRFGRYIALDATGQTVDVDGEAVAEYRFSGVPARLTGLEAEAEWALAGGFSLHGGLDLVRGDNRATGEPLPRLAPLRLRAGVAQQWGAWRLGADLRHAAEQDRVPSTDTGTPASTLLNLWAQWSTRLGGADALWFAKLDNATDRLAYSATTVGTLRGLAPQAGRALTVGLRVAL